MRKTKCSLMVVVFAVPTLGQTDATYLFVSSNSVSPSSPTTTIEIWATWNDPGSLFFFAGSSYDLTAGDGAFLNPVNVLNGPGSTTGAILGNVISGGLNGQFWSGIGPRPMDNPILLATYDWTTTDFSPRAVALFTSNTFHFIVWSVATGGQVSLFPNEFSPGSGVINVVPAPAAWLALSLPLIAGRRRRC